MFLRSCGLSGKKLVFFCSPVTSRLSSRNKNGTLQTTFTTISADIRVQMYSFPNLWSLWWKYLLSLQLVFKNHVEYVYVNTEKEKISFPNKFHSISASTRILKIQNYRYYRQNYKNKFDFYIWFFLVLLIVLMGLWGAWKKMGQSLGRSPFLILVLLPVVLSALTNLPSSSPHTGNIQLTSEAVRLVLKQRACTIGFVSILWNITPTWRLKPQKKMANNSHI